jgi:thiosulfate reductase cytochrome b subunit
MRRKRHVSASPKPVLVRRHSIVVRVTHWLNVVCLTFLLMTGLQIFNAHPRLYVGAYGADADRPLVEIGARGGEDQPRGFLRIGEVTIPTTGVLGVSDRDGETVERGFPSWITFPGYTDLATGRRWHFFFAWFLLFNGLAYLGYGILAGHFWRDLVPNADQLTVAHLQREIADHARLRFPKGEEARRYNALQKMAYLTVIFLLLPLMIVTGATMSPGVDAAFPWLADLFGGRQTARTIHFVTAFCIVGFVVIHLLAVLASGLWNNLRSMVTGRYAIASEKST